jgi:pseudouridine-5'-phosphate glycosidase/pseudouridine kinase
MATRGISILPAPARTAQYVAVNNAHKDLALAMADMSILETIPQATVSELVSQVMQSSPTVFVADGNWSSENLYIWLQAARHASTTTIFEPVSTAKAIRIYPTDTQALFAQSLAERPLADIITPNNHELVALHDSAHQASYFEHPAWFSVIDALGIPPSGLRVPLAIATSSDIVDQGIPQQAIKLLPFFPTILTKLGPQGVLMVKLLEASAPELHDDAQRQFVLARNMTGHEKIGGLYVRLFPPEVVLSPEDIVSVNGIGDTFCGVLAVGLAAGNKVQNIIDFAQRAASLSLRSSESVSPELKTLKGEVANLRG